MIDRDALLSWVNSFAGCDGGNVHADTWLCGIEWGGEGDLDYYQSTLVNNINKGGSTEPPGEPLDWLARIIDKKYRYDKTFVMVHAAMCGKKLASKGDDSTEVINNHAREMTDRNMILKLNLRKL